MQAIYRIKKLTRIATSEELPLAEGLSLSTEEILDLSAAFTNKSSGKNLEVEFELADITETESGNVKLDYFIGPNSKVQAQELNTLIDSYLQTTARIEEILQNFTNHPEDSVKNAADLIKKKHDLEQSIQNLEDRDQLNILIPAQEALLQELQQRFSKAEKLTLQKPATLYTDAEIEHTKQELLKKREETLKNLSEPAIFVKSQGGGEAQGKISSELVNAFLSFIVLALLGGLFSLILGNIPLAILSIIVSVVVSGLFLFARLIPQLPKIIGQANNSKERSVNYNDSNVEAASSNIDLEAKAIQMALARKAESEAADVSERLFTLLEGETVESTRKQILALIEDIRYLKERLNTKDNKEVELGDILEVRRELDIVSIDLSRLQNDLNGNESTSQFASLIVEVDNLKASLNTYNLFLELLESITGFRMLKATEDGIKGSNGLGEWAGLELTPKQVAQLSVIESLEKRLRAEYNAPILILNPKKLFNQHQQSLISKRIYDLLGVDTQFFFVEVV